MSDNTLSPLNNVITIDDERIKSHLDRVVRGTVEETSGGRGNTHLRLPGGALAAHSHQQPARAHPARDPAAAAWPLAARAQQAGKLPTIGYLGSAAPATQGQWVAAFVQRLRELGWIEGRTIAIEYFRARRRCACDARARYRAHIIPLERGASGGLFRRCVAMFIDGMQQPIRPARSSCRTGVESHCLAHDPD